MWALKDGKYAFLLMKLKHSANEKWENAQHCSSLAKLIGKSGD
jgi:hypothetical protein